MVCRNEESFFFLCNPLPGNFMISRTCLSLFSIFNQDGWVCFCVIEKWCVCVYMHVYFLFFFLIFQNMVAEDGKSLNIYVQNILSRNSFALGRGRIPRKGKRLDEETKKELFSGRGSHGGIHCWSPEQRCTFSQRTKERHIFWNVDIKC